MKPSHEYQTGLASVAAFIGTLFKLDVMAYRPPSMEFEANLNLVRYGLMDHLVGLALDILGEDAFGCVLLPTKDMVLGAGKSGAPTLAGAPASLFFPLRSPLIYTLPFIDDQAFLSRR